MHSIVDSPFFRSTSDAHCHQLEVEGAKTLTGFRDIQTHPFLLDALVLFHNAMGSVVHRLAYILPVD
jgi:hypothetical protein